jgi:hypothetical protein
MYEKNTETPLNATEINFLLGKFFLAQKLVSSPKRAQKVILQKW